MSFLSCYPPRTSFVVGGSWDTPYCLSKRQHALYTEHLQTQELLCIGALGLTCKMMRKEYPITFEHCCWCFSLLLFDLVSLLEWMLLKARRVTFPLSIFTAECFQWDPFYPLSEQARDTSFGARIWKKPLWFVRLFGSVGKALVKQ